MVKGLFQIYLPEKKSSWIYSCYYCRTHLALHDALISKSFQGSQGRAYLFGNVVNVRFSEVKQRVLLTGVHIVADVFCLGCDSMLGWKYERAFEPSQRYKEGKIIIELAHLIKDNYWDRDSSVLPLRSRSPATTARTSIQSNSVHVSPNILSSVSCVVENRSKDPPPSPVAKSGDLQVASCSNSFHLTKNLKNDSASNSTILRYRQQLPRSVLSEVEFTSSHNHYEMEACSCSLDSSFASSRRNRNRAFLNVPKKDWPRRKRSHRRAKSSSPSRDCLLAASTSDDGEDH